MPTDVKPNEVVIDDKNPLDKNWAKIAFMVPDSEIELESDRRNKYYSSASAKFTDSRLGSNIGMPVKPQWTRYADIRVKGRMPGRQDVSITNWSGNYGMGSAYSEALDDPAQKLYVRFGVQKYNSLVSFLANAFNREQIIMARTGRAPTALYQAAKAVGTALTVISVPIFAVTILAGKTLNFFFGSATSKFFTLKPTMFYYWNTVNQLCMTHAINSGLIKRVLVEDVRDTGQRLGRPFKLDEGSLDTLRELMPDMFRGGQFDIVAMASRAQRLANNQFEADYRALNNDSAEDFVGYLRRDDRHIRHSTYISNVKGHATLPALFDHVLKFKSYYTAERGQEVTLEMDPRQQPDNPETEKDKNNPVMDHIESMAGYFDAEMREGADWAIFRVEHTGSVQESFGTSVGESDLAQKFNGMSSQFREARFSLADGNLAGGVIQGFTDAITNVAMGALDGVTLGFAGLLSGLGGSGYLDVPKHWQSSTASLPTVSYKMRLSSPYGHIIPQFMGMWIPFYMLLAGILPRSTGKQSYTSPYYCEFYDRGRAQSRLAMMRSLSVTRGTSNLQFDPWGKCLALDVSFEFEDLSTIMHMPMSSGDLLDHDVTMDDDNITKDYLAVLAGMDLYSQVYGWPKAQLKATQMIQNLKYKLTSPAYHSAVFKNSLSNGFLNDITFGATGLITSGASALTAGSSAGNIDGRLAR